MRAVNLIPTEARDGGDSDAAVYGLLGGLALLLLAVTLYVMTASGIARDQNDLARAKQASDSAAQRLQALKPYVDFASTEQARATTVRSLASSRFHWDRTMDDLSRVMGPNVWLSSLTGTVNPQVTLDGGTSSSGASAFRDAMAGPAVTMTGCAVSNDEVVRFVSRLRAMKNVIRVTLADAQKSDTASQTSSGAGSTSAGCGTDRWPQFDLVVFYKDLPTASETSPTTTDGTTGGTTASATGAVPSTVQPASTSATAGTR